MNRRRFLAGGAVLLTLSGSHTHQVSLTADEVSQIAAGTQVVVSSSSNSGHTHVVTFE